ncbi:uncharacterized protein LOC120114637 [Hibiscus syriacus]|uniref:uncharacterized protein LOC120114637 n=1 Tax=Hibiscus syriacus TaxID=106335 RepID=UPI001924AEE6|nr:uncharacterized protein LOC120114637 [Hibiscus syriacus]
MWRKALAGARVQVSITGNNLYVFSFPSESARDWVLENGPWHILNKPLILRKCESNLQKLIFDLSSLSIWVHLYNVTLELYSRLGLSYIASVIGTPLSMDIVTAAKTHLEYAKLCIVIGANDVIPKYVEVELNEGKKVSIMIEVPSMPALCNYCKIFSHNDKGCMQSKNPVTTKPQVWRKKETFYKVTEIESSIGCIELLQEKKDFHSKENNEISAAVEEYDNENNELKDEQQDYCVTVDKKTKKIPSALVENQRKSCASSQGVAAIVKELKSKKKDIVDKSKCAEDKVIRRANQNKVDVFCLLETRVKVEKSVAIIGSKFTGWNAHTNYDYALNGRIWILWRKSLNFSLHDLKAIIGLAPWIIGRDFNITLHSYESSECDLIGPLSSSEMRYFQEDSYLARKLDTVLVNSKWVTTHKDSHVEFQAPGISDHCLAQLLLKNKKDTIRILIDENGNRLESYEQMSAEVIKFFTNLIGTADPAIKDTNQNLLKDLIKYSLPADKANDLVKDVTKEEIKKAFFSQGNEKCPGPDESFLLPAFNATIIAFVPKIPNPSKVKDFRPLSCCSVVYKVISKIMVRRLTTIMPDLVTLNQTAFVKGRSITDNTLLAQELVRGYSRKNLSPRCSLKIDLHKAFDSLNCNFISAILKAIGLPRLLNLAASREVSVSGLSYMWLVEPAVAADWWKRRWQISLA